MSHNQLLASNWHVVVSIVFALLTITDIASGAIAGFSACPELFREHSTSTTLVSEISHRNDSRGSETDREVRALMESLLQTTGHGAVMDYFLTGVYVNALLIERSLPGAVEAFIVQRAREELPGRAMFDIVIDLADAIQSQSPLGKSMTVYRGQAPNVPAPANGVMYETGEILRFPQFLSTTPDLNRARTYLKGIMLEISVPRGKRALNVQKFLGLNSSSYELLFGRGTILKVTDVKSSPDGTFTIVKAKMQVDRAD